MIFIEIYLVYVSSGFRVTTLWEIYKGDKIISTLSHSSHETVILKLNYSFQKSFNIPQIVRII